MEGGSDAAVNRCGWGSLDQGAGFEPAYLSLTAKVLSPVKLPLDRAAADLMRASEVDRVVPTRSGSTSIPVPIPLVDRRLLVEVRGFEPRSLDDSLMPHPRAWLDIPDLGSLERLTGLMEYSGTSQAIVPKLGAIGSAPGGSRS